MKKTAAVLLALCLCLPLCARADLKLPDGLLLIREEAFMGDTSLPPSVTIPDRVTEIGARAFAGSSVRLMYIPATVTTFGEDIFDGCEGIALSGIRGSAAHLYADEYGIPFTAYDEGSLLEFIVQEDGTAAVTGYNGDAEYLAVPATDGEGHPVTRIGYMAFFGKSLVGVTLPAGIVSIGEWAFGSCEELRRVNLPEGLSAIEGYAFYQCSSLTLE